ncbi:hypothetical protein DZA29_11825 [Citrobacter gillenii]|nr:hypothetical protein DZA29_11825 [Citrobacter gillenii]
MSACVNPLATLLCDKQNHGSATVISITDYVDLCYNYMRFEFLCISACLLCNLTGNSSGREFVSDRDTCKKRSIILRRYKLQKTGMTTTDFSRNTEWNY